MKTQENRTFIIFIVFFAMFGSITVGTIMPVFLDTVVVLGKNIPQDDLIGDYVFAVFWSAAIGLGIMFWPVSTKDRMALLLIWTLKVFTTLGFTIFTESHYETADAYSYFIRAEDDKMS